MVPLVYSHTSLARPPCPRAPRVGPMQERRRRRADSGRAVTHCSKMHLFYIALACCFSLNCAAWEAEDVWGSTALDPSNVYFVQVGANCGTPACAVCGESIWNDARKHMWRGIVIEANPSVFYKLRANYLFNPGVRALNVALADRDGTATLHVPILQHRSELASLDSGFAARYLPANETATQPVRVPAITLEALWRHVRSTTVDILQLDLEGMDYSVLLATNFSRLVPKPRYLMYEHFHAPAEKQPQVLAHLRAAGYRELKRFGGCNMFPLDILMELTTQDQPTPPAFAGDGGQDRGFAWTTTQEAVAVHAWPRKATPLRSEDLTAPSAQPTDLQPTTHRLVDTALLLVELAARLQRQTAVPVRVLDVGGTDFRKLAHEAGWHYVTIDLAEPQSEGTGGHQPGADLFYDGRELPFGDDAFDVVILSFVLHHAAEKTLALLGQARAIASSWVIVGEDVASLDYPLAWHQRNFDHAPGGIFRSDEEWRLLFELYKMPVVRAFNVRHRGELFCELSDAEYASRVYRIVYLLRLSPASSNADAASQSCASVEEPPVSTARGQHGQRASASTILPSDPPQGRCSARGDEQVRVAICFFGIVRNIAITLPGLKANLIDAASRLGVADVFVHTLVGRVENSHFPHEQESRIGRDDFMQLRPCRYTVEEQVQVDRAEKLHAKAEATLRRSKLLFREYYDTQTITNVYRSRYSLSRAGRLVRQHERAAGFAYTHVIAARPDTLFLSSLPWHPVLPSGIRVANFEHGGAAFIFENGTTLTIGGINDRFAYGDAPSMLNGYMTQYEEQLGGLQGVSMTTSETLLCEHVVRKNIRVGVVPVCVARIRATGELATYKGQNDLVYPPRSRPGGCRGLAFVQSPSDELNACDSLHHRVPGRSEPTPQQKGAAPASVSAPSEGPQQRPQPQQPQPQQPQARGAVRCVSSSCSKRQAEHPPSCQVVVADFGDESGVRRAVDGARLHGCPIHVISKLLPCPQYLNAAWSGADITCEQLPNLGRDLGSALHFVASAYASLPDKLIFTPSTLAVHGRESRYKALLAQLGDASFDCASDEPSHPRTSITLSEEADFAAAQYSQVGLASASPRIFKRWFETHIGPFATHAARRTCFNGMWTSTRALLQSRERAFYERLRHETDVHASSEAVHYAERAACAIFGGRDPSATTFMAGEAIMATVSLNLKGVRPSVRIMLPDLAPAHEGVCGPAFRVWFVGSHGTHDLPSKTPWCPPLEAGVVMPLPTEVQALLAAESEGTRLHVATAASHWEIPVRELPRVTHHQEVVRRGCCEVEVVCC